MHKLCLICACVCLLACKQKTEDNSRLIAVLKQDLIEKKSLAQSLYDALAFNQYRFPEGIGPAFFNIQCSLVSRYDSIGMTDNTSAISALDSAYERADSFIKRFDTSFKKPVINTKPIKDSLDFYLFKNEYLSNIIKLQRLLCDQAIGIYCGFSWQCPQILPNQQQYKANDTFSAWLVCCRKPPDVGIKEAKLYKNGMLLKSCDDYRKLFKYGPLESGHYTLEAVMGGITCDYIETPMGRKYIRDTCTYLFEVK